MITNKHTIFCAVCLLVTIPPLLTANAVTASEPISARPSSQQTNKLVIATTNNYPPINLLDKNGALTGFGPELSSAVAKYLNREVEYVQTSLWPEVLDWLAQGKVDLNHSTGITAERKSNLDYSVPILELDEVIFVHHTNHKIRSFDMLKGKKVACVKKHLSHLYLKDIPGIDCYMVNTTSEGLAALISQDVDAFVHPDKIVSYLAQSLGLAEHIKIIGEPVRRLSWAMTVKKGNHVLLSQINAAIGALHQNGQYAKIYNKWFSSRLFGAYNQQQINVIIIITTLTTILFALVIGLLFYLQKIRRMQKDLAQNENKYRTLVDNLPQSVFIKDKNLNYISCNKNYAIELAINAEDIIGKNDYELHPEHAEHYRSHDLRVIKEQTTLHIEEEYLKDGQTYTIQTNKTPVYNDDGELIGVLGIFWDITENKKLEQELKEKEQNMRLFMQSTSDCIWSWNMIDNVVERSSGFERAFGYDANEILPGVDWWTERLHDDDRDRVLQTFQAACDSDKSSTGYEYRFRRKDGSYATIIDQVSLIRGKDNKVIRSLGAMRDITQQRQDEAELLRTHQSLTSIQYAMDQIGLGIHFVALDGHFMYVNEAACAMLGYSQEEMLQMSVPDIDPNFPKDDFEKITAPLGELQSGHFETTQKTKDGKTIPVEVIFHFMAGDAKEEPYFITFLTDLTERKQAEAEQDQLHQQIMQAAKMESIGHLTGGLAHDFNNILATMLGYAELLQDKLALPDVPKDKCLQYINQIVQSGYRGTEVVSQMLLFSRKDSSDNTGPVALTTLQTIITEVVDFLQASIPSSIHIGYKVENEKLQARIPPIQLHQILMNLCINARDAIDDYGHITITLASRTINSICSSCHTEFSGDYIELSVSDDGRGISPDLINNIFDPFFSTKQFGQGSGMGLSVVHGIVHSADGHITYCQKSNRGTCFCIYLPCEQNEHSTPIESEHAAIDKPQSKPLEGINLLVLDDEPAITNMLNELLSLRGACVTQHNHALEALADFESRPDDFDLIITDMTMPELSGLDMSRKILQRRSDIPIILCTGYSDSVNEHIAIQAGISRFMLKPLNMKSLIDAIVELTK